MPVLDQFYPFDRPYGAPASAALWGKMAQQFVPDGVVLGSLSGFNASIATGQITVQNGACMIHGYYGEIQNNQTFAVGTNGLVVLGVDMVGESISCYYKDGSLDYNGLTQSATLWEIPLWLITGTTLVDKRSFINPGRGMVTGFSAPGPYTLGVGAINTYNVGTANISAPCILLMVFQAWFAVLSPASAQAITMQGTMQYGLPDQALSVPFEVLRWPGGSGIAAGDSFHFMTSYSYLWGVTTPGKKTFGIRVGNGTGGSSIQTGQLGVQVTQLGSIPNA